MVIPEFVISASNERFIHFMYQMVGQVFKLEAFLSFISQEDYLLKSKMLVSRMLGSNF